MNEDLSLVTIHYEQPYYLARLLESIYGQAVRDVVVVDDGSSSKVDVPFWVNLIERPRHPKNYPQWASCVNAGVKAAKYERVVLISCNWVLGKSFAQSVNESLDQNSDTVWCVPHIPNVPSHIEDPQGVDNRLAYVFDKRVWRPWDERFDRIGGIHQIITWAADMLKHAAFQYSYKLIATHIADAEYRQPYTMPNPFLSWALYTAILNNNKVLQDSIVEHS